MSRNSLDSIRAELEVIPTLPSGTHSCFVECVYLSVVFRYKSDVHCLGIGLSSFEPEKGSFPVTKTPQIRVSVPAFVIYKVCDPKRLQGLGVKSHRTVEITDCENNVVYHVLPSSFAGTRCPPYRIEGLTLTADVLFTAFPAR